MGATNVKDLAEHRRDVGWAEDDPHPDDMDELEPGEQGTMFERGTVKGDGRTLRQMFKPSYEAETTYSVKIRAVKVAAPNGLFDPERECRFMITGEVEDPLPKSRREGRKIIGFDVVQLVRPTFVEDGDQYVVKQDIRDLIAGRTAEDAVAAIVGLLG